MQLDEADELILDIIGKESAVLNGLPIAESSGTDEAATVLEIAPLTSEEGNEIQVETSQPPLPTIATRKRKVGVPDEELVELKKQLFKVEIYKKRLELYELESKLGVPESEFTTRFTNITNIPYEHPVD